MKLMGYFLLVWFSIASYGNNLETLEADLNTMDLKNAYRKQVQNVRISKAEMSFQGELKYISSPLPLVWCEKNNVSNALNLALGDIAQNDIGKAAKRLDSYLENSDAYISNLDSLSEKEKLEFTYIFSILGNLLLEDRSLGIKQKDSTYFRRSYAFAKRLSNVKTKDYPRKKGIYQEVILAKAAHTCNQVYLFNTSDILNNLILNYIKTDESFSNTSIEREITASLSYPTPLSYNSPFHMVLNMLQSKELSFANNTVLALANMEQALQENYTGLKNPLLNYNMALFIEKVILPKVSDKILINHLQQTKENFLSIAEQNFQTLPSIIQSAFAKQLLALKYQNSEEDSFLLSVHVAANLFASDAKVLASENASDLLVLLQTESFHYRTITEAAWKDLVVSICQKYKEEKLINAFINKYLPPDWVKPEQCIFNGATGNNQAKDNTNLINFIYYSALFVLTLLLIIRITNGFIIRMQAKELIDSYYKADVKKLRSKRPS